VTAVPRATCRLIAPWGVLQLGPRPAVIEWLGDGPSDSVRRRLNEVGVATSAGARTGVTDEEMAAATHVLEAAARQGYVVARTITATKGTST
jgi:hypothetical protein